MLPVFLIPSPSIPLLIATKNDLPIVTCAKTRHNMNAFCLLGLGPDLVTPMTKAVVVFSFFFAFLVSYTGLTNYKKRNKKKKRTSLNFSLLPSLFHWTCTRTPLSCASQTICIWTSNYFSTSPHLLRTYFYEEHRNEGRKEGKNEWRNAIQFHIPCFLYFFLYTPLRVCLCVCVWMCVLSLLHKEPTFALIPSPDCSVRCPFSDKERYIRPFVRPMSPKHRLIPTHPHWHSCTFVYNTRLSNHPPPILFVCSLCYCLFPRPNPQIIKCTLLRLVNFSHIFFGIQFEWVEDFCSIDLFSWSLWTCCVLAIESGLRVAWAKGLAPGHPTFTY